VHSPGKLPQSSVINGSPVPPCVGKAAAVAPEGKLVDDLVRSFSCVFVIIKGDHQKIAVFGNPADRGDGFRDRERPAGLAAADGNFIESRRSRAWGGRK